MAASGKYLSPKPNYRFFTTDRPSPPAPPDPIVELNESDIWNVGGFSRSSSPLPTKVRRRSAINFDVDDEGSKKIVVSASLPVNVPDWSKFLRGDDRPVDDDDYDGGVMMGERMMIPPHVYLAEKTARSRVVSYSLHEGLGRTLKGRDLSRVRNAIWAQTGFQD